MTRPAYLLLLVLAFGAWVLALPGGRARAVPVRAAVALAAAGESRAACVEDHVGAQSATPDVPRAPLLARVPTPEAALHRARVRFLRTASAKPRDLRDAVRRVQARRRLPRLGPAEPPWA